MKRCLVFILFAMITTVVNAAAWFIHDNEGCALYSRFLHKDSYYFCGAQDLKCHGDWAEDVEIEGGFINWYKHGDFAILGDNNEKYWCCNGSVTSDTSAITKNKSGNKPSGVQGKWVKSTDGQDFSTSTILTKSVGGGTCNYTETRDICGNVKTTESQCAEQTRDNVSCPSGQYYRASSKSCASLCGSGYAYESATSNVCVECAETATQGIIDPTATGENQICRKCNAATQLFNPSSRTCVSKSGALSTTELVYGKDSHTKSSGKVSDQCWTKFDADYKKCVLGSD